MKYYRSVALVIMLTWVAFGCQNKSSGIVSTAEVEQHLAALEANKAIAIFQIDGKPFYTAAMQPFGVRIDVSFASLRGNLMSSNGDNLLFDFARVEWYTQKPVKFKLISSSSGFSEDYGKFMIGKQLTTGFEKLAGYILVDGTFTVAEFDEEKFVGFVEGKVVKPGDADIPENMKSIEGYIIAKKPPMTFDSIEKEKVFYK